MLSGRLHALGCHYATSRHSATTPSFLLLLRLQPLLHIYRALTNLRHVIAVSLKMKPSKNPQLHKHTDSSTAQQRAPAAALLVRQATPGSLADRWPIVGLRLFGRLSPVGFPRALPSNLWLWVSCKPCDRTADSNFNEPP